MVPLRTGRVFCAVAWAVSEGSNRLLIFEEALLVFGLSTRRLSTACFAMSDTELLFEPNRPAKVYSRLFTSIYKYAPIVHRCYASIAVHAI